MLYTRNTNIFFFFFEALILITQLHPTITNPLIVSLKLNLRICRQSWITIFIIQVYTRTTNIFLCVNYRNLAKSAFMCLLLSITITLMPLEINRMSITKSRVGFFYCVNYRGANERITPNFVINLNFGSRLKSCL